MRVVTRDQRCQWGGAPTPPIYERVGWMARGREYVYLGVCRVQNLKQKWLLNVLYESNICCQLQFSFERWILLQTGCYVGLCGWNEAKWKSSTSFLVYVILCLCPSVVIFTKFLHWGNFTHPPSQIWTKFGMQVWAHGILFRAKLHRDRHNYTIIYNHTWHNHANMTYFGNFAGCCTHTPRSIWPKFGTLE